jgi:lysophospholipase L1-like esterase
VTATGPIPAIDPTCAPLTGAECLGVAPEIVLGQVIPIEDTSGRALRSFHDALRRTERGESQTRILAWGASHTASDLYTGVIRDALQQRFGDAGHGFILPARPWRTYRHRGIDVESNLRAWTTVRVTAAVQRNDYYGLAGVAVQTSRATAFGAVTSAPGHPAGRYELWYLRQPGGGTVDVWIDGRRAGTVRTRADVAAAGYETFRAADREHRFELRARGDGPVRIFGVTVERDTPGVVLDTLGINGSRAQYQLLWDEAMHREHLARRDPHLVILAYGTNEAGDDEPIEEYERELREVIARIRRAVPNASVLLVGPSDRPEVTPEGIVQDRARTAQIIQAQRRVARDQGCGFFDTVAFQGGPLAMLAWSANEPPYGARDHVHFTRRGYERLGVVLHYALMQGYDAATPPPVPPTPLQAPLAPPPAPIPTATTAARASR